MIARVRVLLALDEAQGPAPDRRVVAEQVGTSESTVYLVAKAFTTHAGRVEDVIGRKKRTTPPIEPKVTGDVEARLIALACTQPPAGRAVDAPVAGAAGGLDRRVGGVPGWCGS